MRRGLISWNRAELPEAVLDARVAAAQGAMSAAGLDALIVYTIPARTAGASWLTGFVPYWNEGLVLLPRQGRPKLISALSNRVSGWIKTNAHVEAVLNNPRIGAEAGRLIAAEKASARVGLVDVPLLPAALVDAVREAGHTTVDATDLFAALKAAADPAEIALAARAAHIARAALATAGVVDTDAATLVGRIEGEARRLGAEEVYPAVCADVMRKPSFVRLEGTAALQALFAVRLSVAYKGTWLRMARTFAREPGSAAKLDATSQAFAAAVASLPDTGALTALSRRWLIEGCPTTTPLSALAGTDIDDPLAIPPGSLVSVSALIERDGIPALLAAPALVARDAGRTSLLAVPELAS